VIWVSGLVSVSVLAPDRTLCLFAGMNKPQRMAWRKRLQLPIQTVSDRTYTQQQQSHTHSSAHTSKLRV